MSSRASGRRVDARTFAPSPELAGVVAAYWCGRWDLRDQPPHTTELISDPCINFAFEHGGPQAGHRVVGVWTRLWRRTLQGAGYVRAVKLRAGALRAFSCASAHRLTNRIEPLTTVLDGDLLSLQRAVLGPVDDAEGLLALDDWLLRHRRAQDTEDVATAVALVDRIANDPGLTSVDALSRATGLGVRAVQRLFREHVGATPKWTIRRFRLQEVALRIERGDVLTLAALAAELGYTDQAHLAKDFKAATGRSPHAFARQVQGDRSDPR